jgi:hypothetical protein
MSEFDIEFLNEAIRLSRENLTDRAGGPFGAVIVKDGKIIAEGKNEVILTNDPTAHAEIQAIRYAGKHVNPVRCALRQFTGQGLIKSISQIPEKKPPKSDLMTSIYIQNYLCQIQNAR